MNQSQCHVSNDTHAAARCPSTVPASVSAAATDWRGPASEAKNAEQDAQAASQSSDSVLLDAAYDAYCQLIESGALVQIDDFCAQYSTLGTALRRQIEIHHLIIDHPSLIRECVDPLLPKPGDVLLGFELGEEIGRGSFSRVFRACDTTIGRHVVVKVCCSGTHEAHMLGRLDHENIMPIFSVHRVADSGLNLICMPYIGRTTLYHVLERVWRAGGLPRRADELVAAARAANAPEDRGDEERACGLLRHETYVDGAVYLGLQIAEALAHAHRAGILHLDLKPSNVLVTADGRVKILDFNLAADVQKAAPRLGGTLLYMSPEQTRCFLDGPGADAIDERSDIYSFGVLLHELLCGKLPFAADPSAASSCEAAQEVLKRQLESPVSTPWQRFHVDRQLAAIVERCLAPDPQLRYASAAELAADLRRQISVAGRAKRFLRTHRALALSVVVMALIGAAGAAALLASRDPYSVRELRKGMTALSAHDYQGSIDHLTRSLEADPSQPDALFARAQASVALGNYHDAIRDLTPTTKLASTGENLALLGYCCNCVGSHADAISWYERAIGSGFRSAKLYNNLGFSHYRRGRLSSAMKALDESITMDDMCPTAFFNRATVRYAQALASDLPFTNALHDVQIAMSLGGRSGESYYLAAAILASKASSDTFSKPQAVAYLKLALDNGIPLSAIRSNGELLRLYQELRENDAISERQDMLVRASDAPRFYNPLD